MTRITLITLGFVANLVFGLPIFAQTHLPDVNARNLTVQNLPTFTACTGLMIGAGASPSSCSVPSYFATGTDASHLTGTIAVARMPAFSGGDCTTTAGSVVLNCNLAQYKIVGGSLNPVGRAGGNVGSSARSIVFIGDSITASSALGYSSGYVSKLQAKINAISPLPVSSLVPFADVDYLSGVGTIVNGTSGPLSKSLIMSPGAYVTFTADFVDFVAVYYKQTGTTTSVQITDSSSSVVNNLTTSVGSGDSVQLSDFSTLRHAGAGVTFTVKNNGANNLELNGWFVSHYTPSGPFIQVIAYPGYATGDFASARVLADIGYQTQFNTNPIYVVALGTNDIYAPTKAVSSATYIANINTICSQLIGQTPNGTIILTLPLIPSGASGVPILEPRANYDAALVAYAAAHNYQVVDLRNLDMGSNPTLNYVDNLHPTAFGNEALAEYWWKQLGLEDWTPKEITTPLTPLNGWSQTGGFSSAKIVVRRGRAFLQGVLNQPGSAVGLPVQIASYDNTLAAPPNVQRLLPCTQMGVVQACMLIVKSDGTINLWVTATGSWSSFITLDGLSWSLKY